MGAEPGCLVRSVCCELVLGASGTGRHGRRGRTCPHQVRSLLACQNSGLQSVVEQVGRDLPAMPGQGPRSNLCLLRHFKRILHLDTQVADRTFQFGVTK